MSHVQPHINEAKGEDIFKNCYGHEISCQVRLLIPEDSSSSNGFLKPPSPPLKSVSGDERNF